MAFKYDQGFSQKIEVRKPGWVSGMKGSLRVSENKMKWYEFLIMEFETDFKKEEIGLKEEDVPFTRFRCLVIFLSPTQLEDEEREPLTKGAWTTVSIFDNVISDIIVKREGKIERGIICYKCIEHLNSGSMEQGLKNNSIGYFKREQGFLCDHRVCSVDRKHHCRNLHKDKKILIEPPNQDSQCLRMFLRNGIETIEKTKFKELYRKNLEVGDQIWIYRDRKQNCISKLNPYAHVVVFIGNNEVVHVTPSKCGCCKGIIRRQNIHEVIKDDEDTFFGHNIPGSQHAINIRGDIASQAEACVGLKFNYDHQNNCETFANLLMGFQFSVQGETTHSAVSGIFNCVNCCKCRRNVGDLAPKIRKRLKKRGLMTPGDDSYQRSGSCL